MFIVKATDLYKIEKNKEIRGSFSYNDIKLKISSETLLDLRPLEWKIKQCCVDISHVLFNHPFL